MTHGLLPPDEADSAVLARLRAVVGESGRMLLSIWGLSDSVSPVLSGLTMCVCLLGDGWVSLLNGTTIRSPKPKKTCFINTAGYNHPTPVRMCSTVPSNYSDKYTQQESNLHYSEKRTYFSTRPPACVFVFILRTGAAFLFCVLRETERLPESDSLKPDPAVR